MVVDGDSVVMANSALAEQGGSAVTVAQHAIAGLDQASAGFIQRAAPVGRHAMHQ